MMITFSMSELHQRFSITTIQFTTTTTTNEDDNDDDDDKYGSGLELFFSQFPLSKILSEITRRLRFTISPLQPHTKLHKKRLSFIYLAKIKFQVSFGK